MHISDLVTAIESFAPPHLAEEWDNVGLLIGSAEAAVKGPVLLTIDLTEAVAEEAAGLGCSAVVSYHPPLFRAVKRIVGGAAGSSAERVLLRLITAGIAVYSPHTALDAATGGVTDWLADGLLDTPGAGDRRALRSFARSDAQQEVKVVTFVPAADLERVRAALASAGAGHIGNYDLCSFAIPGTGTFRGKDGSKPAVGTPGHLEEVEEVRLEMVCSRRALALALTTLRQFHPYEEPAVDIYPLESRPDRAVGVGRRLTLDHAAPLRELGERLKKHLGVSAVQIAAPGGDLSLRVARIGVVPGAGASVAPQALAEGCEVFVTGEMKHHDVCAMVAAGMSVILAGHTCTERGFLPRFKEVLEQRARGVRAVVSRADASPLAFV